MGGVGRTTKINHLKGRDFEVPMCGSVYLTNFNPELADCFVIGHEIMCYGSFEECFEQINNILSNSKSVPENKIQAEVELIFEAAYKAKPDAEIAAHFGEVLWTMGQRDRALAIWKEGMLLNADNETLLGTLKRLRVRL